MIINIDASTYNGRIQIGKQGENLTTSVVFDCNAWLSDLDGGTLSIVHQRNSDPDAYPCGDYELDGKVLTWHINETDVAFCGIGACELRYTIGERIAKSKTFVTQTLKGLDPNETPPEAWEPYIDRVIDAATQEMENMTVSASATSGEQTSVSVTKTRIDDHENIDFDFVVEKGDKGDPGQDGQDGKSIVNATASIDANVGTPSVTVTTSSSDAGLSVDLDFHNMKGIPGASFDTSYLPSDTATGNPATFPDGAKAVPVDELTAEIKVVQSGTPTPSSPIPLVGYTEANITHNGETDTIPFGQTVYGGSLNVTTGVLTISQAIATSNQNTSYTKISSGTSYKENSFTTNIVYSVIRKPASASERIIDLLCSYYKVSSNSAYADIDDKSFMVRTDGRFYIWDSAFENATTDEFKAHMNGAEFVYPLADPVTVQLTPDEVRTVLGNNSISSDLGGDVTVIYRADIGLYIDKKLS